MQFASALGRLGTESSFDVLAKARKMEFEQGAKIVHLEIGEPDFETPRNIKGEAVWALYHDKTHYTPSAGLYSLRVAVSDYINRTRDLKTDYENVVVGPGGKPVIVMAFMAALNPGDEVIIPNPTYPAYASFANYLGAKVVDLPLTEATGFSFHADELAQLVTKKTKMIVLNSPANPTGGMLEKKDLQAAAKVAVENDLWVLSDEIYSRNVYEGVHESIASLPGMAERTILVDGFSKAYAMTGWRLGYAVANKDMAGYLGKLMNNINSCAASFTQFAGIEALNGLQHDVEKMMAEFKARRDLIVNGLNKIDGVSCTLPRGAFYVFPNIKKLGQPSKKVADFLLDVAHVAGLPGTAFGSYGEGYLRFSYAASRENLQLALDRIEEKLPELG